MKNKKCQCSGKPIYYDVNIFDKIFSNKNDDYTWMNRPWRKTPWEEEMEKKDKEYENINIIKDRINKLKYEYNKCKYIFKETFNKENSQWVLSLFMPGLNKDNIDLNYCNDSFLISYKGLYNNSKEIEFKHCINVKGYLKNEYIENIRSTYTNGVLNIYISTHLENKKDLKINIS